MWLCSFCYPCIVRWADIETRCPYCKARFQTISRKQLTRAASSSDASSTEGLGPQRLQGEVLEVLHAPERNQVDTHPGMALLIPYRQEAEVRYSKLLSRVAAMVAFARSWTHLSVRVVWAGGYCHDMTLSSDPLPFSFTCCTDPMWLLHLAFCLVESWSGSMTYHS